MSAASEPTPGLTEPLYKDGDRGVAAAASLLCRLAGGLNLVAGAGRAFRSPNLVERFFTGLSPEGSTYWRYNPALRAETSLDLQFGLRFLSRSVRLEASAFRNAIRDGIRRIATGDSVNGFPEVRYENVDALRYAGIELGADVALAPGVSLLGHYTRAWTANTGDRSLPLGDSYASKLVGTIRYGAPGRGWWAEYQTRHSGRRADAELGRSVVGSEIPAFTVHATRGGARVAGRFRLGLAVENLFDTLCAEAPNVAFFRPDPGRSVTVSVSAEF